MKFKNVLLLYKRSAYRIYFLDDASSLKKKKSPFIEEEMHRFEQAHDAHYDTLKQVSKFLLTNGIRFSESYRGRSINYAHYDLIITVGGDGTFLEAARNSKNQVILGINSAPGYSVGNFCIANKNNFEKALAKVINDDYKIGLLQRLKISLGNSKEEIHALNDVLICHANPAYLCRYYLRIGQKKEEQRSSGVWISTPSGSTGAIYSAGGKKLNLFDTKFQYKPRELYKSGSKIYNLCGAILGKNQKIDVTSLMRKGMIYVDGAHQQFHFEYGTEATVSLSAHPIKTIRFKS